MSFNQKPVFGYWNIRGLGHPIRMLCHYLDIDYEEKTYTKKTNSIENKWLEVKFTLGLDFPNIPYWVDDKVKLTEMKAIMRYLTRTHGPILMPSSPETLARGEMVEGFIQDLHTPLIRLLFYLESTPPPAEKIVEFEESIVQGFQQLEKFLGQNQWILGDKLYYVDFYVYEVVFHHQKYRKDFLQPYPSLAAYVERFENLPKIVDFFKTHPRAQLTCYTSDASIFF